MIKAEEKEHSVTTTIYGDLVTTLFEFQALIGAMRRKLTDTFGETLADECIAMAARLAYAKDAEEEEAIAKEHLDRLDRIEETFLAEVKNGDL